MNVTSIVTNILSTHDNNTIPTTQAVYEYAAAAVDLDNDVTYTSGATGVTAEDNLFNYYDKDEVNNLLNEKENHPTAGNFFPFLDLSNSANDVLCQSAFPGHN